jgi:hypothetical protein
MSHDLPARRHSASAPFVPEPLPTSARERILLALELGRRGQVLQKRGQHAEPGRDTRPR